MPNVPVCQQRSRNWPTIRIGYINISPGQIWQFEPVEPSGASRPVVVRGQIVTNNDKWMRDAAIAGVGISVFPVFIIVKALGEQSAYQRSVPDVCPVADAISAVYPRNRHLPKKVRSSLTT